MKTFANTLLFIALAFSATNCSQKYDPLKVGGVPGWMLDGAEISDEPAPRRPDPNDLTDERLGGPLEFKFEKKVETPEQATARKKAVADLFED
ncbi:MAG: hypothetical protein ACKVJU_12845 [Verrucomicrobiales bacterium]